VMYRVDEKGEFKKDGSHPLYLYGYGSYGLSMSPTFSTVRLSLIDRGFVFAIAHIRGGSEMGRQWYETGKFLQKKNTFKDFIASTEHLIQEGFSKKGEIAIAGGSAGGMLMGAVINERPELFKASVAHVPFVDVINTMLDETLPLTTIEFEEWGNPKDPTYYHYMKSYSPYDNVKNQNYPHLLVTSGLNDPRVTYWEPAKWVAKLREMKTDQNLLLQHINMEAGHGGPSGRYENLKLHTLEYAFLLKVFDRNMFGRAKKGA
jgi:oligopeptidase B